MGYTIDWGSAEVQEGQLSVRVRPDPDFAFLKVFDMVLIDGSEFTGEVELGKVIGARLILLDDTNTFKCFRARQRLLADPDYEVIADDQTLRNGFAAFRRRAHERATTFV